MVASAGWGDGMEAFDLAVVAKLLRGSLFGGDLQHLSACASTNREVATRAAAGAAEGLVLLAEEQSAGRGRMGRQWFSPPGLNLYCSILLRPALPPLQAATLPLLAGVAVARTVASLTAREALVKWPNDVVLEGRKLCGILCEMHFQGEQPEYIVLGIGLNVNLTLAQLPPELHHRATSLHIATGHPFSRTEVLVALLRELEGLYRQWAQAGLAPLLPLLDRLDWLRGREIKLEQGREVLRGRAAGITPAGALLLRTAQGVQEIYSGEAHLGLEGAAP